MSDAREIQQPFSRADVPFLQALSQYEWVPNYVKAELLRGDLKKLKEEARHLKKTPPSLESFKARLKKSHKNYMGRRAQAVARYLKRSRNSHDPFRRLERATETKTEIYISWAEISAALQTLSIDDGIADKNRASQMATLDQQIIDLRKSIADASPQSYFLISGAQITCDCREVYVGWWRRLQEKLSAPCGPRGIELSRSSSVEQEAYKILGLQKFVNSKARLAPHPGARYVA